MAMSMNLTMQLVALLASALTLYYTFNFFSGNKAQDIVEATTHNHRPNFIVLFADDLGWGDIGANWPATTDTPNIDALARNGIRLTDFHAGASVCTPSRASLLTGRLGLRTGVVRNFGSHSYGGLPVNETTLAESLKAAGYKTAHIGKWHLGYMNGFHPNKRGFDFYYGVPYSVDMGCSNDGGADLPPCTPCPLEERAKFERMQVEGQIFDQNYDMAVNDHVGNCDQSIALPILENFTVVEQPATLSGVSTSYAEKAKQFLKASGQNPFFLYLAFSHVHVPLGVRSEFNHSSQHGTFGDALREMDWIVGEVVSTLWQLGLENNTMVWFTGDNGPWAYKCDLAGSAGPFEGGWQAIHGGGGSKKTTIFEGGHREPGIVYWPTKIPPGTVNHALVSTLDIFPTVAAIAGVPMPPNRRFDGIDIRSVLFENNPLGHEFLFHPNSGGFGENGNIEGVRFGSFKAIYTTGGVIGCGGVTGPGEYHDPPLLFDLEADPGETTPLDTSTEPYSTILRMVEGAKEMKLHDIANDNTSVANYSTGINARVCCNAEDYLCRCKHQLQTIIKI